MDRTRLRLPDFNLTQENAGAIVRVCRKLDGMPLAIELATARMGALAVEQVAQRLEVSLDVLSGSLLQSDVWARSPVIGLLDRGKYAPMQPHNQGLWRRLILRFPKPTNYR